ncbi:MAG: phosphotransferase [Lachnospiraceae bacterium]|nr:phosphotransferase [Lachnospiraceae bacterium]
MHGTDSLHSTQSINKRYRNRNYTSLPLDGLTLLGKGAKGAVYRYDQELILKVYNHLNTLQDIEQEFELTRKALVAGLPVAIPFGIISLDGGYGALYEMVGSETISNRIASDPSQVSVYARSMADFALQLHSTDGSHMDLPDYREQIERWINTGIATVDQHLTRRIRSLVDAIPRVSTILHGDFHVGNVMVQKDEYLLIDLDRLSVGHPVMELGGLHTFYVALGEQSPDIVRDFMGFSYDTALKFYQDFLSCYLRNMEENRAHSFRQMAALLSYIRCFSRCLRQNTAAPARDNAADSFLEKIRALSAMLSPESLDL